MSTSNEYRGERLSFFKLFSQKHYKLVIPIIQRDYAQGRTNDETGEVRTEFLEALYTYLDENRPNRDLDFVYGTLQKNNEDEYVRFVPLDGQQRLTTLFLLHWFLFQISENEGLKRVYKEVMMSGNQSLFTYETRQSSTDFCDALMRATIDMEHLAMRKRKDGEDELSLSATLQNEPWFFRFWKNDPTIQSMLVMLDEIYYKFIGRGDFFERLLDEQNPIITFIFMDLKEYKLSDDLYMKMNSRGKPLSKFENFKAKFEQYIKQFGEDSPRKFSLAFSNEEKSVDLKQYFSFNIDTKWTTLFWQYCKNGKQDKLDSYIENLFRVIVTNYYASIVRLQDKDSSDSTFDVLMGDVKSLTFTKYEATKVLTYDAVLAVIDSFDALYNGTQKIANYISPSYSAYYDENQIFCKAIENKLTRAERMQFFAYIQYLIRYKDKMEGIDEWMRIVHNLTHPDNTITNSNDDFSRGIKSIDRLLPYAPTIIRYLQEITTIAGFSKHQSSEECIKAHLVEREGWRDLIEETEKHSCFNGQIGFILEFSGICDYYYMDKNLDWSKEKNEELRNTFARYSKIARHIFSLNDKGERFNDKNYCFERAVLAHGNYLLEGNPGYWNLLSTETVDKNVKRDLSWKRMLRMGEDEGMQKGKSLVKATFDDVADLNDITGSFEKLCIPETEHKWRDILIALPEMIDVCEKGFVYFGDTILLLSKWYLNHYHCELFTYSLWVNKFEDEKVTFEGFSTEYAWQKRSDIDPHILIKDFSYRHNKYKIEIYAGTENGDFDKFQIVFCFNNENKSDYPDDVTEIITGLGFKKKDGANWFEWCCKSEGGAFRKTKELTELLFQLKQK